MLPLLSYRGSRGINHISRSERHDEIVINAWIGCENIGAVEVELFELIYTTGFFQSQKKKGLYKLGINRLSSS